MGRPVQLGQESPYYDNSPFCVGYRDGTIQTLVPAPECWDLTAAPGGEFVGPLPPVPVYTTTTYGLAPGGDNTWLWILGAVALFLALDSGGRRGRR